MAEMKYDQFGKDWGIDHTPADPTAIKIYEPVMKNPNDSLVYALEQIQAYQMPAADAYQKMADPSSPFVSVFTGRAEVTQMENAQALLSPPPMLPSENPSPMHIFLMGIGAVAVVYFLFLKGN